MNRTLYPASIYGQVDIPASKGQTIRALLIALFAKGVSKIHNPLISSDTKACIDYCIKLGAKVDYIDDTIIVDSTNLNSNASFEIDCRDSGTTLYFTTALSCLLNNEITLNCDEILQKRPAGPLLVSLQELGATIRPSNTDSPPYTVKGPLIGGHTKIRCMTSQYLSALLLTCPLAQSDTTIDVSMLQEKQYVVMTERWLVRQGISFFRNDQMSRYTIYGNQKYKSFETTINGNFASAAYFLCAAAITGSTITLNGLDSNSTQADLEVLTILSRMGCSISKNANSITITGPARLTASDFDVNTVPDSLPALAIAASFATGPVKLYNVPQARYKKSDRISTIVQNLNAIGGQAKELPDGLIVFPVDSFKSGTVKSFKDPSIVMAMAIASLKCNGPLTICDSECVDETFPAFFDKLKSISVS
ncbi:MAG: 3-phosphoshikimate 1-carboxyvinyltransferase [Sphaerochaetaceae bacterium]|nr:3-phosphoshikimate 1-carboxyvinyltransferase [Sphaerochaetaceae bacterium]